MVRFEVYAGLGPRGGCVGDAQVSLLYQPTPRVVVPLLPADRASPVRGLNAFVHIGGLADVGCNLIRTNTAEGQSRIGLYGHRVGHSLARGRPKFGSAVPRVRYSKIWRRVAMWV